MSAPTLARPWPTVRSKVLWTHVDERSVTGDGTLLSVSKYRGILPRSEATDREGRAESLVGYKRCNPGDLVINRMSASDGALGIALQGGLVSPDYSVFRPRAEVDARFYGYLYRTSRYLDQFALAARGIGVGSESNVRTPRLNPDAFGNVRVPQPPFDTQRAIADYLDRETARIDEVIEKRRKLLELTSERLAAVIEQATTGLDKGSRMVRSTGIPGMPLVAADWAVMPLKAGWKVIDCKHRTPTYIDEGYPVVSTGDIRRGVLDLRSATRFVDRIDFMDMTESGRRPKSGDIIYSRNASVGTACLVSSDSEFCMGQDVVLITSVQHDASFLMFFLNGPGAKQLGAVSVGATFKRINVPQIRGLKVPFPPRPIQEEVAARLSREQGTHDRAVELLTQQISLLEERRQSQVTAAVMGQIDRTEAA